MGGALRAGANVERAELREVTAWLGANTPADVATCIIHNDFRLDNVVLDRADPTRVVGVLDWEMATLGDPLMDLGSSLAYWIEAGDDLVARATRRQPTHLPGMLTRSEVVDYYCDRMGLRIVEPGVLRGLRPLSPRWDHPADLLPLSPARDA